MADPPWYEPGNFGPPKSTPSAAPKKKKKTTRLPSDYIYGVEAYEGESTGYTPWQAGPFPASPTDPTAPPATDTGDNGDGTSTTPADTEPVVDWHSWLENWGFPPDVISKLDEMARLYPASRGDLFVRDAIYYLRGTDWHKQMFVGFSEAVRSGLLTDERQYRQYVNGVNDAYKRYLNRNITNEELTQMFNFAWDPTRVEGELAAGAYAQANEGDINYLFGAFDEGALTPEQLKNFGRQKVGIGNQQGNDLLRRVSLAQDRLRRVFEGTLATSALGVGPTGRLASSSMNPGTLTPDIGR